MERKVLLLVVALSAVLAVGVAPAAAQEIDDLAVDVTQSDDGTPTVSVTDNGTAVTNASVSVETVDENVTYNGTGEYLTDENGTVELPAPESNVTVSVTATAGNQTATTEKTLTAAESEEPSFGQLVSSFVNSLTANETEEPIGVLVSNFVLDNNPAADMIPDNAGPPENRTGPPENRTGPPENRTGPPSDVGPDGDTGPPENRTGPPDDVGPDGETGPPEDAGPGEDGGDDTEEDETEDDGNQGPPDHAGPP